jgi:putative transposase
VPADGAAHVQQAQSDAESEALRRCVVRGGPFGAGAWMAETAEQLGLQASLWPRGRPRKAPPATPSLFPE